MIHSFRRQFLYELKSVLFGYPGFVYFDLGVSSIPVFVYHTIEPKIFESHLAYLRNNNYRTLSIHEYSNQLNREPVNNKFVLITIDDARSSVWRYAFPLLKKYGMNASVFVIPGFTIETNECRDNLFDVWNGKKNMEQIRNIDPEDNTLCTWQEILSMYKSGLINIESHTLFHREIFKSTKIVDYIIPEREVTPYNFNGSPYLSNSDIGKELNPDEYIGLPLFESAPLMLAGPRLNISPEFKAKCKEIYNYYNLLSLSKVVSFIHT